MGMSSDDMLRIPRNVWTVTSSELRDMWKDYPEFQEIFPDLLSNLDYDKAIVRAVEDFNDQPPETDLAPHSFPHKGLLRKKAFCEVLRTVILYHANNYFTGQSGGIQIPVHERFQALQPMLAALLAEVKELEMRIKRKINTLNGFGTTNHYQALGYYGNRSR